MWWSADYSSAGSFFMTETEAQRQKEIQQAEELLFAGPQALGFVKGLFQRHFVSDWVMPYPRLAAGQQGGLAKTQKQLAGVLGARHNTVTTRRNVATLPEEI